MLVINGSNQIVIAKSGVQGAKGDKGDKGDSGSGAFNIAILTATNGQTQFTLPALPVSPTITMLFVNGVRYEFLDDYTLSGYTLNWIGRFALSSEYQIRFYY